MKKYILFIMSFVVLILLFQWGTGLILTIFDSPDMSTLNSTNLNTNVEFGIMTVSTITFFINLLAATFAFLIAQKWVRGS